MKTRGITCKLQASFKKNFEVFLYIPRLLSILGVILLVIFHYYDYCRSLQFIFHLKYLQRLVYLNSLHRHRQISNFRIRTLQISKFSVGCGVGVRKNFEVFPRIPRLLNILGAVLLEFFFIVIIFIRVIFFAPATACISAKIPSEVLVCLNSSHRHRQIRNIWIRTLHITKLSVGCGKFSISFFLSRFPVFSNTQLSLTQTLHFNLKFALITFH